MAATIVAGIDFGTTKACIAVYQNGRITIVRNNEGDLSTPCYVAFTKTDRLMGYAAKDQADTNPHNTIFDIKRLIGRKFDDPKLPDDMKHWPYSVINVRGHPAIEIEYKDKIKKFNPEEICAMILIKMKDIAESCYNTKIHNVVISVPASFNDSQRQATVDAGSLAGFNVLGIINEPLAVALAYGINKCIVGLQYFIVFDLGGGTLDVSVVAITDGTSFEVKATASNARLGGADFDNRLLNFLAENCKRKFRQDVRQYPHALRRLRTAAEKAKHRLSTKKEATIHIDALYEGHDFVFTISRWRFEEICFDLFVAVTKTMETALKDAKIDIDLIDHVILMGESNRMPKIHHLLWNCFKKKALDLFIMPEGAVAFGAAIKASILVNDGSSVYQNFKLTDVTAMTLGIETNGCVMTKLINRNVNVPCKKKQTYTTKEDNQEDMTVKLFEGESVATKYNKYLGTVTIHDLSPVPCGRAQIKVTYWIDTNGILQVIAEERLRGYTRNLRVTDDTGHFTEADIEEISAELEIYRREEQKKQRNLEAKNRFEIFFQITKEEAEEAGEKISEHERTIILNECDNALTWLETTGLNKKKVYEAVTEEFTTAYKDILSKLRGSGDADPGDADLDDIDPEDIDPTNADPVDIDPADANPANADPGDIDPDNVDLANADPGDINPGDADPTDANPANADPGDIDPGDVDPANVDPDDADFGDIDPADANLDEADSDEADPGDIHPADANPDDADFGDLDPADEITTETDE